VQPLLVPLQILKSILEYVHQCRLVHSVPSFNHILLNDLGSFVTFFSHFKHTSVDMPEFYGVMQNSVHYVHLLSGKMGALQFEI
jgi:hypothetical protein